MSKYDIIIIGSGLGGLECGAILSKEGFNVCVVEKNTQFGGCFQTYRRKGHLFDTGIHYVGSLDEGQVMNQYFRYFGIMDKLKLKRLDDEAFDTIYYKGKTYDYAMGYPQFIETICRSFPHEKENLKRYAEQLQTVGNLISVDHLKQGTLALEGMKYFCTSAAGLIADITPDPTFDRRIYHRFQLHLSMQDMCGSRPDPVFCFLIDRNGCNQLSYANMFQLPVEIQIHQADKLQIAFTPVSQYQSDKLDKLSGRFTVTIGSCAD